MALSIQQLQKDGTRLIRLESNFLRVDVAPEVGGRIVSVLDQATGHEFLWRNPQLKLERLASGSEYDPNFYGGIDELLPNDIPEQMNGIDCPDHGELWTTALNAQVSDNALCLAGTLPKFGLKYEREMRLAEDAPKLTLKYRLTNATESVRQFLWKLHAAIAIESGDVIDCPAQKAQVVDPAWCRFKSVAPFVWPWVERTNASIVPAADGTMDFFYLFDLSSGQMGWRRPASNLSFVYGFDTKVFPYVWLFASYGGFNGHYTAILEPCTAMPISVKEAAARNQCTKLQPGETLETIVTILAGPDL